MGSVRFGIPRELTLALKTKYGIERFVETGTLGGHTAMWAEEHFASVISVDIELQGTFGGKVIYVEMDSAEYLEFFAITEPTIFWLDAHTNESCPVLREISAINKSPLRHVILVDDARLFDALTAWPRKADVIAALENGGKRTVWEVEDVLVAEPCL
jgi:hypothetical protein